MNDAMKKALEELGISDSATLAEAMKAMRPLNISLMVSRAPAMQPAGKMAAMEADQPVLMPAS